MTRQLRLYEVQRDGNEFQNFALISFRAIRTKAGPLSFPLGDL